MAKGNKFKPGQRSEKKMNYTVEVSSTKNHTLLALVISS